MPIIDTPTCNLLYSKDAESGFQPKTIKDDMLCAGFAEGKKDACKVGAAVGPAGAEPCSLGPCSAGSRPGWEEEAPSRWGHGPDQSLASLQWGSAEGGGEGPPLLHPSSGVLLPDPTQHSRHTGLQWGPGTGTFNKPLQG